MTMEDTYMTHPNSFNARSELKVGDKSYEIYRLEALHDEHNDVHSLPYGLKVLLENLLRTEDGVNVTAEDIRFLSSWEPRSKIGRASCRERVAVQEVTKSMHKR